MSTLVEISEHVTRELQRPELVEDYRGEDFTPTAMFLNLIYKAHLHLDRRMPHDNRLFTERLSLPQGQWWLDLPDTVKHIRRIDIEDDDRNIIPGRGLIRRESRDLRDKYGQYFNLVEQGEPQYWCHNLPLNNAPATDALENGDFGADLDNWTTALGTPTVVDDNLVLTSSAGTTPDIIYQRMDSAVDGDLDITLIINSVTAGGAVLLAVGTWNTTYSDITIVTGATYTTSGTKTLSPTGDWDVIVIAGGLNVSAVDSIVESVSVALPSDTEPDPSIASDIITMPPADKDYTAVIECAEYAEKMTLNHDESWWSGQHPDILELAVKRQIARDLNRNSSEVKEYDDDIELALLDIDSDEGIEKVSGPDITMRFGWHP